MPRARKAERHPEEPTPKIRVLSCHLQIPKIQKAFGKLLSCGQGDMGQLGLGEDVLERKRPTEVGDLNDIVEICAGGMHSLALSKDGILYSFGCNDEGALGRDCSKEGSDCVPGKVDLAGKCVKISAGDSHSACLLEDGRVFAWGSFRDSHGTIGLTLEGKKPLPIELLPDIKSCDIASGADHLVILTCRGKIYTIGCGEQGQLGRVTLRSASGETRRGKTEILNPCAVNIRDATYIDAIWATTYSTFIRDYKTKNVLAFGLNNYNQLATKSSIELIITPTVTKIEDVLTISGGQHHSLVLKEDNNCYAIGRIDYGRLGIGNISENVNELKLVTGFNDEKIIDVQCGEAQSFAITNEGNLYAWGMGSNQQLGTGNEDDEWEPVLIRSKQTEDKRILKVSSGGQHTLFLVENDVKFDAVSTTTINKNKNKMEVSETKGINKPSTTKRASAKDDVLMEKTDDNDDVDDVNVPKINGVDKDKEDSNKNNNQVQEIPKKRGRKKKN